MKRIAVLIVTIAVFFCTSGCAGLRSKFVRKKRAEKKPVVYVDYKQYSDVPPRESYQEYYVFTQGWLSEALQSLRYSGNRKKIRQAFSEALINIEQMLFFLDQDGQDQLASLHARLQELQEEYIAFSANEMKKSSIINRLESFSREFQRKFSMNNAAQWML